MRTEFFDKEKNQKERLAFIDLWAEYVLSHSDEDWSRQQNILINSQIQNARKLRADKNQK